MYANYWVVFALFLLVFLMYSRRKRKVVTAAHIHHIKKRKEEILLMETLAKEFIGKECIFYTISTDDGSLQGTVKEVRDGGVLIEDAQGQRQAINLEYVTRIREFPRNKKGKKKNVVID